MTETTTADARARSVGGAADAATRAVEAVWRIEQAKLIAGLTRMVRDVGLAEEFAQEALIAALRQWPAQGVPDRPGAWLMATAKRHALDHLRRGKMLDRKHAEIGRDLEAEQDPTAELHEALDDEIGDDLLRLMFVSCHPVLSAEARTALTLKLIGGLSTEEIARAFLVPEPTLAQRIVRAKRMLSEANVPFEVPRGAELSERLGSVLEVIYLIFNEGYAATAGDDWLRPQLCDEALRLGRILSGLAPGEAEVHGLVALMEIQASRMRARTGPAGEPILLLEQNRGLWDQMLIRRGLAALRRAERIGGVPGPYFLQASIAACHARAGKAEDTQWRRIAALYSVLAIVSPSPVVDLNRAVAVSMAFGPAEGLKLVDTLAASKALENYHLLPSVRGDLLFKVGRYAEAQREFLRAAGITRNQPERDLLLSRAGEAAAKSALPG